MRQATTKNATSVTVSSALLNWLEWKLTRQPERGHFSQKEAAFTSFMQ